MGRGGGRDCAEAGCQNPEHSTPPEIPENREISGILPGLKGY